MAEDPLCAGHRMPSLLSRFTLPITPFLQNLKSRF